MLLTATKTVDVIRFCLYWVYVAMMVLLLTDGLRVVGAPRAAPGSDDARGDGATATAATDDDAAADADAGTAADADAATAATGGDEASLPACSSHALRRGLLCALVAAESLTLATWYLVHRVIPWLGFGLATHPHHSPLTTQPSPSPSPSSNPKPNPNPTPNQVPHPPRDAGRRARTRLTRRHSPHPNPKPMPALTLCLLVSRADLRLRWHIEALSPEAADGGGGDSGGGGPEDGGEAGCHRFRYRRRPWGLRVGRGLPLTLTPTLAQTQT